MPRNKIFKFAALIAVLGLVATASFASNAHAFTNPSFVNWYWTSDTTIKAVAVGDVTGDGLTDVVTGGYFHDGLRWTAQLIVWNPATNTAQLLATWYTVNDTQISSIALSNMTGSRGLDIIVGGACWDGTRWNSQLSVWNGTNLALEKSVNWFWTNNTQISAVAVANITGNANMEIVTGGSFFDGTRTQAQMIVWNSSNLAAENLITWYWTSNTYINTLAIADLTGAGGNGSLSIVTGGTFFDGVRNTAQLVKWNASSLAVQGVMTWYWTADTSIDTLAIANVTGGTSLSIVTGGTYFDGTRNAAQIVTWNGTTLAAQAVVAWFWTGNTQVNSLAIGNYTGGANLDVLSAGFYNDGVRNNAQLVDWDGGTMAMKSVVTWSYISSTELNAVAFANFTGTVTGPRVVTGGEYYDNFRSAAQLYLWV